MSSARRPEHERGGGAPIADAWFADARRLRWTVIAIVALALFVRVVYVLQSRSSPLFDAPEMDARYHVDWASAFARGETFEQGPYFRAPLYPWMLGVLFELFGPGLLLPRLVQALLGAATTALTFAIGARAIDRRTGVLAALFAALSWVLVFYDGELLLESLSIPLNLLALWLALRFADRPGVARAALCGVAFGVAAICRPNVLLVAPAIALWMLARDRTAWRRSIAATAGFALALALPILPVTIRNRVVGHDDVLISSQAGLNLWIGNNPWSDGSTAIVPGTREDWWGGYHDTIAQAEAIEGRDLKPSEVSEHYTRRALAFWREQTSTAVGLLARKLRLFWLDWELGNNDEPRFLARRFAPVSRWLPVSFGWIAALAAVGVIASLARWRRAAVLHGYLVLYGASVVAFFVCSRYRAPILPVLMVFAAFGVWWMIDAIARRRWGAFAWAAALAAASMAASYRNPPELKTGDANGLYMLGGVALRQGDPKLALQYLEASRALDPRFYIVERDLGAVHRRLGDAERAREHLERALELAPNDVTTLDALADLHLARGDAPAALPYARRAIELAEHDARGHYAFGRVLAATGDFAGARDAFERASERDPKAFNAAYSLGVMRQALGDGTGAIDALRRAVDATASDEDASFVRDAYARLLDLLIRAGRAAEARELADRALARFPSDAQLEKLARSLRGG